MDKGLRLVEPLGVELIPKESDFLSSSEGFYLVILFKGRASFSVDFVRYESNGMGIMFLSPYQTVKWHLLDAPSLLALKFHGDFYCIEYHRQEVSCNGLLFNNLYGRPFLCVDETVFQEVYDIVNKIAGIRNSMQRIDVPVLRSYLQLILAISSREKQAEMGKSELEILKSSIVGFPDLLENNFLKNREVSFYAQHYGLSIGAFSKKVRRLFNRPPSKLIEERLVLEAKKLLHMSYRSNKEIARELGFSDEFYFSRFFKKAVGFSPKIFRKNTGFSVMAK